MVYFPGGQNIDKKKEAQKKRKKYKTVTKRDRS